MDHEYHGGHGTHRGDHSPATGQLSPNEHRQHAEPDTHGGHGGGHEGHGAHGGHGDHAAQFRDRFWLSLALTIPVVLYSEMVQEWLGFTPPAFPGSQWVAPVLGTVVFLYGGRPFLEGGLAELRSRQPGMMLLISLAILVAFGASVATVFGVFDLEFWWELAAADRDHAARSLAGDAGPRPGLQRPGRPGRPAARRGRPGHRRGDQDGPDQRAGRWRRGPGPPGGPGPGRRRGRGRGSRAG